MSSGISQVSTQSRMPRWNVRDWVAGSKAGCSNNVARIDSSAGINCAYSVRAFVVGSMPRPVRTSISSPKTFRSRASTALIAGCPRNKRSAARETLFSLTSTWKATTRFRSIFLKSFSLIDIIIPIDLNDIYDEGIVRPADPDKLFWRTPNSYAKNTGRSRLLSNANTTRQENRTPEFLARDADVRRHRGRRTCDMAGPSRDGGLTPQRHP